MDKTEKIFTGVILTSVWIAIVVWLAVLDYKINNIILTMVCLAIYIIFCMVDKRKEKAKQKRWEEDLKKRML